MLRELNTIIILSTPGSKTLSERKKLYHRNKLFEKSITQLKGKLQNVELTIRIYFALESFDIQ